MCYENFQLPFTYSILISRDVCIIDILYEHYVGILTSSSIQVCHSIAEILELCFSFGELVQGLHSEEFPLPAESLATLELISKVCHRVEDIVVCINVCDSAKCSTVMVFIVITGI